MKSNSQTSGFSAVIIRDSGYKITNADINLDSKSDGTDVNDFAGYGAGVVVYGKSKVEIENSKITTTGVGKAATSADKGADLIVRSSTLSTKGGTIYKDYKSTATQSYMICPPWVLGIAGSSRTTNVMGAYTTGTYVDTTFNAADWGAVSIDSGSYIYNDFPGVLNYRLRFHFKHDGITESLFHGLIPRPPCFFLHHGRYVFFLHFGSARVGVHNGLFDHLQFLGQLFKVRRLVCVPYSHCRVVDHKNAAPGDLDNVPGHCNDRGRAGAPAINFHCYFCGYIPQAAIDRVCCENITATRIDPHHQFFHVPHCR